jgi:hypothetical protein
VKIHFAAPKPITIGKGDSSFHLTLKPITGLTRSHILDALTRFNFESLYASCVPLITGWTGILDEDGQPIPFLTSDGTDSKSNVHEVMGLLPLPLYAEVFAGVLGMAGLPASSIEALLGGFAAAFSIEDIDLGKSSKPGGNTGTDA